MAVLRRAAGVGLVVAIVMLYLAGVGLIGAFADRQVVTGYLSLGRLMLLAPLLVGGYAMARQAGSIVRRLALGAAAGGIGGAVFALAILIVLALSPGVRDVFIRINNNLLDFVFFGLDPGPAAVLNVGLGTGLGLVGASLPVVPPVVRRGLLVGLAGVVLMSGLEPFVRPRLTDFDLHDIVLFLYEDQGLIPLAAVIVFAASALLGVIWRPARDQVRRRFAEADPGAQRMWRWVAVLLLIAFIVTLPQLTGVFLTQVLVLVGLYILLGLGLNIVVGYAGLLDLGYVAFYAVGAYFTALLTSPTSSLAIGLSFWAALPLVVIGSAMIGLFIGAPVLRLRGDYLAIVTLGFGEIARVLFLSDALAPWFGGVQGILSIPDIIGEGSYTIPLLGEIKGPAATYYPLVAFCGVAAFVAWRLKYSRTGRAWNAMREDEDVAQATGVNIVNYKLLAFAMGAAIGCLGGAIFATHLESVFPGTFNVLVSITVLAVVILGGMGSIPGVVFGSLALIGLPELLREFAEFKLLVYGGVVMLMMILRPEGFVPDVTRRRELHEAEEEPEEGDDTADFENSEPTRTAAPSQA
ncbi:MAG: branched-chain amino acid ABC transporter permease [Candidatus Limnocylindria bacterium]